MLSGRESTSAQRWKPEKGWESDGISPEDHNGICSPPHQLCMSEWVFMCVSGGLSSLSVKMLISLLRNQCAPPPPTLVPSPSIHVSLPMLLDLTQVQAVSQSAVHKPHTHTHSFAGSYSAAVPLCPHHSAAEHHTVLRKLRVQNFWFRFSVKIIFWLCSDYIWLQFWIFYFLDVIKCFCMLNVMWKPARTLD